MKRDILFSTTLIAFSAIFYYMARSFPSKDALLPKTALFGMLILSFILLINSIINKKSKDSTSLNLKTFNNSIFKMFLLTVVYLFLLPYMGYFPSTFLLLIFGMKILEIKRALIFKATIGYILLSWIFFVKVLSVPLPIGLFFKKFI